MTHILNFFHRIYIFLHFPFYQLVLELALYRKKRLRLFRFPDFQIYVPDDLELRARAVATHVTLHTGSPVRVLPHPSPIVRVTPTSTCPAPHLAADLYTAVLYVCPPEVRAFHREVQAAAAALARADALDSPSPLRESLRAQLTELGAL